MVYNQNELLLKMVLICFLSTELSFGKLCDNKYVKTKGCSGIQPVGHEDSKASCLVKSLGPDSTECKDLKFGPIVSSSLNGGVRLKPYKLILNELENVTGLNITFSNIEWQSMKIRLQRMESRVQINHCADISVMNNVTEIYYDCYFSEKDHISTRFYLDFEATGLGISYRGQYGFYMPSLDWFDENVTINDWKPFIYVEYLINSMKLHVMPSPEHLKVSAYNIMVKRDCFEDGVCVKDGTQYDSSKFVKNFTTQNSINLTEEFIYTYTFPNEGGSYYFVVIPMVNNLAQTCQKVESPEIIRDHPINHWAIFGVIILTILVTLGIVHWLSDCCTHGKHPRDIKILVIYDNKGRAHNKCVAATVAQLMDFNFIVKYDGNIRREEDVNMWVLRAFDESTHIMFVRGPRYNLTDSNNILNITEIQLNLVRNSTQNKIPFNVVYDYSDGEIPDVLRGAQKFHAIKDMYKLKAFLTKTVWDTITSCLQNVSISNKYTDIIIEESTLLLNYKENLKS